MIFSVGQNSAKKTKFDRCGCYRQEKLFRISWCLCSTRQSIYSAQTRTQVSRLVLDDSICRAVPSFQSDSAQSGGLPDGAVGRQVANEQKFPAPEQSRRGQDEPIVFDRNKRWRESVCCQCRVTRLVTLGWIVICDHQHMLRRLRRRYFFFTRKSQTSSTRVSPRSASLMYRGAIIRCMRGMRLRKIRNGSGESRPVRESSLLSRTLLPKQISKSIVFAGCCIAKEIDPLCTHKIQHVFFSRNWM